ncbi:sensor histidine kinase [Streptomyces sp. NPDC002888]|uniref:sensor histidine kinase n=1 Tax=Streptomyces sp. NPDC002888 TaxID=3364668 RepID=UPI0036C67031
MASVSGPGSVGAAPSRIVDSGLRRAAAGLIGAACVQVAVCVVVTRSGYPVVFWALVCPVFLVPTLVGLLGLLLGADSTRWVIGLCCLFAVFSVTASWAVAHRYTGAVNVAEPLIGLGVFGAGMSGGRHSGAAALALIGSHRGALAVAGTGSLVEHASLALLETGSLVAALLGCAKVRVLAQPLDDAARELARQSELDAAETARTNARHERARLLHDEPQTRLAMVGQAVVADSAEFRADCARDADLLRGRALGRHSGPGLTESLRALVEHFEARGLRVRLDTEGRTDGAEEPYVVTALVRAAHEALTNVLRHSGTREADLVVGGTAERLVVEIRDGGRGFDAEPAPDRMGVRGSLRARMEDVGGKADIRSAPGRGTSVVLRWPV